MVDSPSRPAVVDMAPAPPAGESDIDYGIDIHLDDSGKPRIVERRFVVEPAFVGMRLDHYLKRQMPRLSRNKIQKIIRTQTAPIRGRILKPHSPVLVGDEIVIRRDAQPEPPCPRTFAVLYQDHELLVIDKPAGLPVHASAKFYFNTLTRVLSERFPEQRLQICHRLDRETSGALVVARGKEAAARLKGTFANRKVSKTYWAIVWGQPDFAGDQSGMIDLPLGLVSDPAARIAIRMEVRKGALPSRTQVRVLAQRRHCALVECRPITGRQHQIRAHLAAIGHPIVGDKLYAHGEDIFAQYCDQGMTPALLNLLQLPRQALHAAAIEVPRVWISSAPAARHLRVTAPMPADMAAFLDAPDIVPPKLAPPPFASA